MSEEELLSLRNYVQVLEMENTSRETERVSLLGQISRLEQENQSLKARMDRDQEKEILSMKVLELEQLLKSRVQNETSLGLQQKLSEYESQIVKLNKKVFVLNEEISDLQLTIQQLQQQKRLLVSNVQDMKAELELNYCAIDNKKQDEQKSKISYVETIKKLIEGNESKRQGDIKEIIFAVQTIKAQNEQFASSITSLKEVVQKSIEKQVSHKTENKEDKQTNRKNSEVSQNKTLEEIAQSLTYPNHLTLYQNKKIKQSTTQSLSKTQRIVPHTAKFSKKSFDKDTNGDHHAEAFTSSPKHPTSHLSNNPDNSYQSEKEKWMALGTRIEALKNENQQIKRSMLLYK